MLQKVLYMSLVKLYFIRLLSLASAYKIKREGKDMCGDVSRAHAYLSGLPTTRSVFIDRFKNMYMNTGLCLESPHKHQP